MVAEQDDRLEVAFLPIIIILFGLRQFFISLVKYGQIVDFGIRISDLRYSVSFING